MTTKIAAYTNTTLATLVTDVNSFLANNNKYRTVDIKYFETITTANDVVYSAMVIYEIS